MKDVLEFARKHGLDEFADRLAELAEMELDPGHEPVNVHSAMRFVKFCAFMKPKERPLISVTPMGEIGATFTLSPERKCTMRFGLSGDVWMHVVLPED